MTFIKYYIKHMKLNGHVNVPYQDTAENCQALTMLKPPNGKELRQVGILLQ